MTGTAEEHARWLVDWFDRLRDAGLVAHIEDADPVAGTDGRPPVVSVVVCRVIDGRRDALISLDGLEVWALFVAPNRGGLVDTAFARLRAQFARPRCGRIDG